MDDLLSLLSQQPDAVALTWLAAQTGLNISTTHRILNDLAVAGWVERVETGQYRLGMRFLEMAQRVRQRLDVRTVALPVMRELHQLTGHTLNLSLRQQDHIVYIERVFNQLSGMQVVRAIGGRAPLHLTSSGKLFLADHADTLIHQYAGRTQLAGQTPQSCTELSALLDEIQRVRQQGYAEDVEELERGVCCVAVPIRDDQGVVQAGLSISAPVIQNAHQWLAQLLEAGLRISHQLGWRG
jgi:IclR family acetate operon transcriptional repressor